MVPMNDFWSTAFGPLVPTVVVLALFTYVLRSIIRMDRREREVYSKIEAEERAKRGMPDRT